MNLEDILSDEKGSKKAANSLHTEEDISVKDETADQKIGEKDDAAEAKTFSKGELLEAYQEAQRRYLEKAEEADRYRQALEELGRDTQLLAQKADNEAFMSRVREYFATDPVGATEAMIKKSQQDLVSFIDMRIAQAIEEHRNFGRLMTNLLNDPANARLKPYEAELEFLIRDKGLSPSEAVELLRALDTKRSTAGQKRAAIAKEIRNRSMLESDGEIGEPLDVDKEIDKILIKSKNLDEMFAGLRKLKL